MTPSDIPRSDRPAPGAEPRTVQFRTDPSPGRHRRSRGWSLLGRRGFLGVLGAGAMTLGMTMLGWIPLARRARAEEGTEYPDCGRYSNGPGGPICLGARYSPTYCGDDNWFITGCYERRGFGVCFYPIEICRSDPNSNEGRNAWRWMSEGIEYRCADGHAYWEGAPNPELVICSARLTPDPSTVSPPPSEPPSLPTPTSSPASLPDLSSLPLLPR